MEDKNQRAGGGPNPEDSHGRAGGFGVTLRKSARKRPILITAQFLSWQGAGKKVSVKLGHGLPTFLHTSGVAIATANTNC